MKQNELTGKIREYLKEAGYAVCTKWIASGVREAQPRVSRELKKLVKAGEIKYQTRIEFDLEYNKSFGFIRCKRRRNYYWLSQ